MSKMLQGALSLLAATSGLVSLVAADSQQVLAPPTNPTAVDGVSIEEVLDLHDDPVDAYLSIFPDAVNELREPRLLRVAGKEAEWMTEGDKMRLRRKHLHFMDITDHADFYADLEAQAASTDKPRKSSIQKERQRLTNTQVCLT